jgi:hypothetical protein
MKEKTHALESEQSSVFSGDLLYDVLAMNFLIFFSWNWILLFKQQ